MERKETSERAIPAQTGIELYTTYTLHDGVLRGLSFGGGARYVSVQPTSYDGSTKELPGYSLVDLVLYTAQNWLLRLGARNVLDRYYALNNYQTLLYGNQLGAPTNSALTIRRTF